MSSTIRTSIEAHWNLSNTRSWDQFAALLHPDLRYECPQTREYIDGALGYLELFRTWPGGQISGHPSKSRIPAANS